MGWALRVFEVSLKFQIIKKNAYILFYNRTKNAEALIALKPAIFSLQRFQFNETCFKRLKTSHLIKLKTRQIVFVSEKQTQSA